MAFLSFLSVSLIFLIVLILSHVYPFGDRCILRTDMYHQYAPFFMELKNKLSSGGSLLFSRKLGLGVNFIAVIAYYLASPLNLLLVITPTDHVIEFMTLLIVIKSSLAASFMSLYLLNRDERAYIPSFIIGCFYGLSGYICAYYWNIMWLDSVMVFPLIVLFLERMLRGRSGLPYALCLGYAIFTNYYISIPICIFLVIYFFLLSFLDEPCSAGRIAAGFIRFLLYSLIAAGLAALLILPEIYNFTLTASSSNTFPRSVSDYFSVLSMLARHLPFTETEQGLDHWPNIYAGTFVIPFFFLYLWDRRIGIREKIAYTGFCFLLLTSFALNFLNFIWHGLHYPNSLPARQSFLYIFLVLFMCFRVLTTLRAFSMREVARSFLLSTALILIFQQTVSDDAFSILSFYPALILVSAYMGFIALYRAGVISRRAALVLIALLALTELSANTAYTSVTTSSRASFTADNASARALSAKAQEISSGDFYRLERNERKSKNDGAWIGFPSASFFSSTVNKDLSSLYKKLGMEASTNAYSVVGSTPLTDMLLGIRFRLSSSGSQETDISHIVAEEDGMYLYEEEFSLSPAFVMPEAFADGWFLELSDPALVQNSIADVLLAPQVLIPVYNGGVSAEGEFAITVSEDGLYLAYEGEPDAGDISVRYSDRKKTFSNLDRGYFMELGVLSRGELLNFSAQNAGIDPMITVYRVDTAAISEIYEALSESELKISEFSDTMMRGTVDVDTAALGYSVDRARMIVTLPYDDGYRVYIDGEETEAIKVLDAFLGFYISSGTHEVEIVYRPVGLAEGAAVSIISLIALIALYLTERRRYNKARCEEESDDIA